MKIQCPKCGGEHVQSVRVVVQSGTTHTTGVFTGVGVGTDGVGGGVGYSSSVGKTSLASKFSPPDKPTKLPTIILGLAALGSTPWLQAHGDDVGFRYASMVVWTIFALIVWKDVRDWKKYKEYFGIWQPLYNKGFHCNSCGASFIPN
jgi:hypothetical protein